MICNTRKPITKTYQPRQLLNIGGCPPRLSSTDFIVYRFLVNKSPAASPKTNPSSKPILTLLMSSPTPSPMMMAVMAAVLPLLLEGCSGIRIRLSYLMLKYWRISDKRQAHPLAIRGKKQVRYTQIHPCHAAQQSGCHPSPFRPHPSWKKSG